MSSLILWPFHLFSIPNVYLISAQLADSAVFPFESQTSLLKTVPNKKKYTTCAAKAFCYCPAIISHRPGSQNILKEAQLNPEKDSRIKRARSHVSLEKSS
jgi:hypothetical protein